MADMFVPFSEVLQLPHKNQKRAAFEHRVAGPTYASHAPESQRFAAKSLI